MQIHPSILSADFAHLADEIGRIENSDAIHVDVMDNHFVPNLTMGLPVVKAIRAATHKPLDIRSSRIQTEWSAAYILSGGLG